MTEGTNQGLFIVVAIVIFGLFVAMSYTIFGDTLQPALADIFGYTQDKGNFDKDADYNVEGVVPNEESDFIFDNVDTIIGYIGSDTEVVIPNTIDGLAVTKISGDAFNDKGLTKLIMPNSLTTIEDGSIVTETAFKNTNLDSVEEDSTKNKLFSENSFIMTVSAAEAEPVAKTVIGAFANNEIKEISFSANLKYIGSFAFFSGDLLEDVILPEGLVVIEESAFEENLIEELEIPASVEFLGNNAFKDNELTDVVYAKGSKLTSIGSNVFSGNNIKNLEIPNGTRIIAPYAYSNAGLESVEIPKGTQTIGKYAFSNNKLESVTIPDTVTSIEASAFRENILTNVDLPEGLISIGDYAFYKNLLPVINLPESLLNIGTYAFYQNKLLDVDIPRNLKTIKTWTFAYNQMPKKPTIPSNIETEEDYAFYGNLFSDVKKPSDYYNGKDLGISSETDFTFNKATQTITNYTGTASDIVIPYEIGGIEVKHIGAYALNSGSIAGYNRILVDLTSVVIPNTVETIGNFSFYSNDNSQKLTSLTIGSNVKTIGNYAFANHNLESVNIPDSVETIGDYSFYDNSTSINKYSMKTLTLGSSLKTIGKSAFAYNSLSTVTIPKSVTTIASDAFKANSLLSTVNVSDVNTSPLLKNPIDVFSSKPSIIYAQPYKFNKNTGTIEDYWGLDTKVTIPFSIDNVTVKHIGGYAFNSGSIAGYNRILVDLTSVVIPNTVETIGNFSFYSNVNSQKLTSLTIGSNVKTIGNYAFANHNLESVNIPESVETIGDYAFYDYSTNINKYSMKTLTLGSSLKTIGKSAFAYNSLSTVTIPESVTTIASDAFNANSLLSTVNVSDVNTSPLLKNPIDVFSSKPSIIYTQPYKFNKNTGTIEDYWGLDTKVTIPSSIDNVTVKHIGAYALNSGSIAGYNRILVDLTSVVIPNTVETIGNFSFYSNDNSQKLTSLTIGSNVKTIGNYAFANHNLESVNIPDSVETIGDYSFYDNSTNINKYSMKTLTLGSSLKTIGKSAFAYNSLSTVTIPKSVTTIASDAFNANSGITIVR